MRRAKEKLIVALDVASVEHARELVEELRELVGMFKIGSQLFTAAGPDFVREIVASGARIFLDLKFHDIPSTVAAAGVEATRLGVSIFNVHAAGGREMMRRTAAAVSDAAQKEGLSRPCIIAVTVLTSADSATLAETGSGSDLEQRVKGLAVLAAESGMDGVVASPREVRLVRSAVTRPDFLIVAPGVRPAAVKSDDQKRVMTPAEALKAGANYLVVGRPIVGAGNPAEAAQGILAGLEAVIP